MPDTLHPPYLPTSQQYPKQINRWLDVNAQNGPLKRVWTFFTIPAFGPCDVDWQGYSQLLGYINYVSPNNFSLKQIPDLVDCPFLVVLRSGSKRYTLNAGSGEVVWFQTEAYTNQTINKNFTVELWSTAYSLNQSSTDYRLFTGVRGTLDYRHGVDSALFPVLAWSEPLSAESIDGNFNLPIVFGAAPVQVVLTDDLGNVLTDDQGNPILP